MNFRPSPAAFFTVLFVIVPVFQAQATDLVRISAGARAMGAANVAGLANDPLSSISANPAFLSGQEKSFQASLQTIWVDSEFTSSLDEQSSADSGPGLIPDIGFVLPLDSSKWTLGGGITVHSGMLASFDFTDPPGTLGVTYGHQTHEAQFSVINASAALAYQVNDNLSVGAQLGMAYNRNQLLAPYIFQSHPALSGLKVLVDLDVDDLSPSFSLGMDYQSDEGRRYYAAYSIENKFSAKGDTRGNLGQLGLFAQEDFAYDTQVNTAMPAFAMAGTTWPANDNLTLGIQIDWIGWGSAFEDLPILLTNGTNDELNALLGDSSIADTAPLDWENQVTFKVGGEYSDNTRVYRLGYEYSNVPVPTSTMTPMTGATLQHALSAGVSMPFNGHTIDFSYRLGMDSGTTMIDALDLQGGEYSGSRLDLMVHSISVAIEF